MLIVYVSVETMLGVGNGSYTVARTQCNIGDSKCKSTFDPTACQILSVASGETQSISVTAATLQ